MVYNLKLVLLRDLKISMINIKIHLRNHNLGIKHKINKYKILTIKQ